ncbi:MAG: PxKF domain-containing protein, partial [Actinomycetota bacterium]
PVNASYSCDDATSRIDTCSGTVADGAAIDTGSVGSKSFAVAAADMAGNLASASASYSVLYAGVGTKCGGVDGHIILQPIAVDGSSSFQHNSTVPAKFRVCDFFGTPVTTPRGVSSWGIVSPSPQSVTSTSAHETWRAGDSQWIFNISTKPLNAGQRYGFEIGFDDGSTIDFAFTVR